MEADLVLSSMPDGLVVYDRDGNVTWLNEPARAILGTPSPEFANAPVARALRGEEAPCEDLEYGAGGRDSLWLSVSAAPLRGRDGDIRGAVLTCRDVTALHKAEAHARQTEESLRDLIERAPTGIYEVDFFAQRFLRVNQAICKVLGYTKEELLAMTPLDLLDEESRAGFAERIAESLATQPLDDSAEFAVRTKDGRLINVVLHPTFIWRDGSVTSVLVFAYDVTTRHQADMALRGFLASLSHELRNPLASIRNCLSLLSRAEPGSDRAARAAAIAERQVGHLSRLIDDLLDVTRIQRGRVVLRRRSTDLVQLVGRVAEDQRPLFAERGVALQIEPAGPDAPHIYADVDPDRAVQVVGNLLHNAAKFTPSGGRAWVSVARDKAARQAVIRVADTGIGMTSETLSRLFVPFTQADTSLSREAGGLGLGLALARGLVELHGGSVTARSAGLGQGAEFVVSFPTATVLPTPAEAVRAAGPRPSRLLVIDDNPDQVESLTELLKLDGHEVAAAYDGPGGLARARDFHPAAVLCDIGLPGMDGYAVARAFREDEALARVYLIALSGYASPDDVRRCAEAGYDRHLAKPASLDELRQVLAELPS